MLHVKDLLPVVGSIRDVNTVTYFRRIDLFVFARDKQCSDTDKLEFGSQDIDLAAISVNYTNAEIQRLWDEAEFHVHFDEPINEDCPHPGIYIFLSSHLRFHFVSYWWRFKGSEREGSGDERLL